MVHVFARPLAGFALLFCLSAARGDDWPQWFGPKRDAVWREQGILAKFPAGGVKPLWRVPLGPGYSGPAVAGGRVYVLDRQRAKDNKGKKSVFQTGPGTERVLCLNAEDGKLVWKHEYDCPYVEVYYPSGPRTTPIVEGGRVYTLGTMGHLFCLEAGTGKVVWARDFRKDLEAPLPVWGWAANPLIDGDRLYCLVGGEKSAVVAFDKHTGKELWRALTTQEVGYAPPMVYEVGGRKQLVVLLSETLNGLDAETGKVFWTIPHPADGKVQRPAVTITTPRLAGDVVYVSNFYNGTLAVKLAADRPTASVLWRGKSTNPMKADGLHGLITTPAIKNGYLYGVCTQGELRCLKADTGERVWESLAAFGGERALFGTIFLVEQGDRWFLFTDQGDLIIARLSPKGYEEMDRARLIRPVQPARGGRTVVWSHPAFANRCVYVRNDEEIVCVSLAAPK